MINNLSLLFSLRAGHRDILSHSLTHSRPLDPLSEECCPGVKECHTETPRGIWTDRLCWVPPHSPLSPPYLLVLDHAFLSSHTSTCLSMLQSCLCSHDNPKGQSSGKVWTAERVEACSSPRRVEHPTARHRGSCPGDTSSPGLCISLPYLFAFKYPWQASRHSTINVSLARWGFQSSKSKSDDQKFWRSVIFFLASDPLSLREKGQNWGVLENTQLNICCTAACGLAGGEKSPHILGSVSWACRRRTCVVSVSSVG